MSAQSPRALLLRRSVADFQRRVNEIMDYWEANPQTNLGELERETRRLSRDCFALVLEGLLEWRGQEMERLSRCECGRELRYKGRQPRSQETLAGRITWQRGYYYCGSCRRGSCPLDEVMDIGPGQFSDGLQRGYAGWGRPCPLARRRTPFWK